MNGRLYDAVVGRMLSADKYVADASNSQAYNRYSYCSNNPLKYTDPSGWRQQGAWYEKIGDNDATTGAGGGGYIGRLSNLGGAQEFASDGTFGTHYDYETGQYVDFRGREVPWQVAVAGAMKVAGNDAKTYTSPLAGVITCQLQTVLNREIIFKFKVWFMKKIIRNFSQQLSMTGNLC